jgi:1-acyl-sn-glycerol-3-phosphate acyltransferase
VAVAGFALIGEFPHASLVVHAFLRRIPLSGQALNMIGAVFVGPGSAGRGIEAIDLYLGRRGAVRSMIILPEGRITRDGKIHRFRRGFVHIQRQTSFDVLPVTLNGLFRLKPFGRLYADPDAKPEMVIHPAIKSSVADQMSDEELISVVKETVESVYRP